MLSIAVPACGDAGEAPSEDAAAFAELFSSSPESIVLRYEIDELEAADIPGRPPALRLEVRADGTARRWDADAEDYVSTTLQLPQTAAIGSDGWAAAGGLGPDYIDYSVPLHCVETIDVISPRGELRTVSWTCGSPPGGIPELLDVVENTLEGGIR